MSDLSETAIAARSRSGHHARGGGGVGILRSGTGSRAIGLRAELDALPVNERTGPPYASRKTGVMHVCGHDGHTAMLLGAARLLSEAPNFDGTLVFLFQPAEENEGGGLRMIEDGVFTRFPVEAVYALHNWPGLDLGMIAARTGPQMAAVNGFELAFEGDGAHAATPHLGDDPVLAAGAFIGALQRVVAAAARVVGPDRVKTDFAPSLGCEDFAYMTRAVGGAYAWIGTGAAGPGAGLHGDRYVFNDEIVPVGLRYWLALAKRCLPSGSTRPEAE
jgi:metal-dependent amidase/aminoacylase/carboxypeptidase family protein